MYFYLYLSMNLSNWDSNVSVSDLFVSLQVGNLAAPVAEWTVGGTALPSLMDVERRHGMPFIFYLTIVVSQVILKLYSCCR